MTPSSTQSITSALALTERLLKQIETARRATLNHIVADLETELAKIKKERETLIEENLALKSKLQN